MANRGFTRRHNAAQRFMPAVIESAVIDGIKTARRDYRNTMAHLEECPTCLQAYQSGFAQFQARHIRCEQDMPSFIDMAMVADDVVGAMDRFGHVVDHLTECSFCSEVFNSTMALTVEMEGEQGKMRFARYLARLVSLVKKL